MKMKRKEGGYISNGKELGVAGLKSCGDCTACQVSIFKKHNMGGWDTVPYSCHGRYPLHLTNGKNLTVMDGSPAPIGMMGWSQWSLKFILIDKADSTVALLLSGDLNLYSTSQAANEGFAEMRKVFQ